MNMLRAKLVVAVVRRGRGDYVAELSRRAGATGGTILFGRGTGSSQILRMLGLADIRKELLFTVANSHKAQEIIAVLKSDIALCNKAPGIGFVIDVTSFLNPSAQNSNMAASGETGMEQKTEHELVCAIVNAGLADDVMHEARQAGAKGGTILKARGTATGQDSNFFGITIVPEKEFLMILTPRSQSDTIAEAVANAKCLAQPGSGIVFRMPVEEFFQLGAKTRAQEY